MPETTRVQGDFEVTIPEKSRVLPSGRSTCPSTHGGTGEHFFIRNRDLTAFRCGCGATAVRRPTTAEKVRE